MNFCLNALHQIVHRNVARGADQHPLLSIDRLLEDDLDHGGGLSRSWGAVHHHQVLGSEGVGHRALLRVVQGRREEDEVGRRRSAAAESLAEGGEGGAEDAVDHAPGLGRSGSARVDLGKPIQGCLQASEGHIVGKLLDANGLREVLVVVDVLADQGNRGFFDTVHYALKNDFAARVAFGRLAGNYVVGMKFVRRQCLVAFVRRSLLEGDEGVAQQAALHGADHQASERSASFQQPLDAILRLSSQRRQALLLLCFLLKVDEPGRPLNEGVDRDVLDPAIPGLGLARVLGLHAAPCRPPPSS